MDRFECSLYLFPKLCLGKLLSETWFSAEITENRWGP